MPPLVGDAVKVTLVPEQIGLEDGVIATFTAKTGLTSIVILLEIEGLTATQGALEVILQLITSPLSKAVFE